MPDPGFYARNPFGFTSDTPNPIVRTVYPEYWNVRDLLEKANRRMTDQLPKRTHGVAIFSGGLDSTTLVYHLLDQGRDLHLLSFDYGQRHGRKELKAAQNIAQSLGLRWDLVDLTGLTHLISNSALTSLQEFPSRNPGTGESWTRKEFESLAGSHPEPIEVPEGHYAEDNMKLTVVPNRNMIMLSIAAGVAVNEKANFIAAGMHAGDHFVYPDCRPQFLYEVAMAIWKGNEGMHDFGMVTSSMLQGSIPQPLVGEFGNELIVTPFLHCSKADIAYRALELGVPLHLTWSCYKGGDKHCGRCGTCVERLEAIDEAQKRAITNNLPRALAGQGMIKYSDTWDLTEYEDTEFWKVTIAEAKK